MTATATSVACHPKALFAVRHQRQRRARLPRHLWHQHRRLAHRHRACCAARAQRPHCRHHHLLPPRDSIGLRVSRKARADRACARGSRPPARALSRAAEGRSSMVTAMSVANHPPHRCSRRWPDQTVWSSPRQRRRTCREHRSAPCDRTLASLGRTPGCVWRRGPGSAPVWSRCLQHPQSTRRQQSSRIRPCPRIAATVAIVASQSGEPPRISPRAPRRESATTVAHGSLSTRRSSPVR